jgi:arylsulfatase A-like enzyme
MIIRFFSLGFAWLAVLLASGRAADLPNVVVFNCDDLGYGDLRCYGAKSIETPHLDRLADDGARFTSFYAAAAVCSPSRAGLITGRYGARYSISTALGRDVRRGLPPGELTLGRVFKQAGYATAAFGKWHLGIGETALPTAHGFDVYAGVPFSHDMGVCADDAGAPKKGEPVPWMVGTEVVESPVAAAQLTEKTTQAAIRFIEGHAPTPFFAYIAYNMPHVPIAASKSFKGRSKGGPYGDVVEEIDAGVGEITDLLRRLGIAKNTLVIFTSDNGPWLKQGARAGSAGPLRGGKATMFEGGTRVPGIFYWPGRIAAGQTIDTPASQLDLMPTFLEMLGTPPPQDVTFDGRSILPLLVEGRPPPAPFQFVYWRGSSPGGLRVGDWKLIAPGRRDADGEGPMLFNLREDLGEKNNLATAESKRLEDMLAKLKSYQSLTGKEKPRVE